MPGRPLPYSRHEFGKTCKQQAQTLEAGPEVLAAPEEPPPSSMPRLPTLPSTLRTAPAPGSRPVLAGPEDVSMLAAPWCAGVPACVLDDMSAADALR